MRPRALIVMASLLAPTLSACAPLPVGLSHPRHSSGSAPVVAPAVAYTPVADSGEAQNVYASTMTGQISPALAGIKPRVYVPNSDSTTVVVIDPSTLQVIDHYVVGSIPHHIAPAWDLSKLYVDNEGSASFTVIDPTSGRPSGTIPVPYPYNLYFTPDGTRAVVVVERLSRIDFRDPHDWSLIKTLPIPWPGIDHLDFSADGSYLIATTEWSGMVVKIDTRSMSIVGSLHVGGSPIDVRLAPDGSVFYVANQVRNGVSIIDGQALKEINFIPTDKGAHGLYVSRDTTRMYLTNRLAGTISVIDIATQKVMDTWRVGGSPDMIQISPDGTQLWTTGRYDGYVYVVDTRTGSLIKRIYSGPGAHGLTYFPNAGAHSLGHNGVYR